ncbi:MAG: alkaline phosphatase family protein [Bacteroidetes bacterium]|nr:alkaline phosphatase family protein [Bacteroidota bacterium]
MKKLFFLTTFVFVLFLGFVPVKRNKLKTENVIIVVIDGPRYSETWGDSALQYIPMMSGKLLPEGVLYKNFRNVGHTYTNAGHTSICTGVDQSINNFGLEIPENPSVFQYYLSAKNVDAEKAWIITSKDKLEILANCTDTAWKGKFRPSTDCGAKGLSSGYRDDSLTISNTIAIIKKHHPHLILVNLKEPDFSGHANNWEGYLKGIRSGDKYVYQLWQAIQNDPVYAGKTTLLITSDHGRHLDGVKSGFTNHGDDCEGCRHINLLALGPDFKKNVVLDSTRNQKDIASTVAYLLDFQMPTSKGEVLNEMFK